MYDANRTAAFFPLQGQSHTTQTVRHVQPIEKHIQHYNLPLKKESPYNMLQQLCDSSFSLSYRALQKSPPAVEGLPSTVAPPC